MHATRRASLRRRRRSLLLVRLFAALALTFTPLASAQVIDVGGSATGTGTYAGSSTLTLAVAGTPQAATGTVTYADSTDTLVGTARCIAIDDTLTGRRASIAGEITGGTAFVVDGYRGFELTVYDNTPSAQIDQVSFIDPFPLPRTSCAFDKARDFTLRAGDFTVVPLAVCPPNDDEDNDGLTDHNENLFSTLLGNADSDFDGIADGNDDGNGNGEDDEDEDDDDDDGCPDADSDGDGEDDEDEDD
jgi:hypothetical protein